MTPTDHDRTSPAGDNNDVTWMRAALDWSRRGRGWTSPRPSVGCVIVRDGRILGGGHTQPGHGNPHAEVTALQAAEAAGEDVRGATAYVTLEPCCHFATTPPCTRALIAAGIVRVVCGVGDPNPAVNGRGYEELRAAGVEVVTGFLADECMRAQDDFLKHIVDQTPFVTLKCAISLDGKIATATGESKWITGEEARERGHRLRHEHDAVMVGIGTAIADDPQLNVRLPGEWKQPDRVVLDSSARLPLGAKLLQGGQRVFVATTEDAPTERLDALSATGAQIVTTPAQDTHVDLTFLAQRLYEYGICSILIEGGAHVAGAALAAGIVDKVVFFVAPVLIGDGQNVLQGVGTNSLAEAWRLRDVQVERVGADIMISGYLRGKE